MYKNMSKASLYCLKRSKDTIINALGILLISFFIVFAMKTTLLEIKGENYILLIMYLLLIASTLIQANSMIVDLTVKDILSNRIQFFLSNGIIFHKLIISYTVQMFLISSMVPLLIFFIVPTYVLRLNSISLLQLSVVYISTAILSFLEILTFNVMSFSVKRYKFFKNILFFGSFFFLYLIGMFANEILTFIESTRMSEWLFLLVINLLICMPLLFLSLKKYASLTNEAIISSTGKWI